MTATLLPLFTLNMSAHRSGYDTMASWDRFTTLQVEDQIHTPCGADAPMSTTPLRPISHRGGVRLQKLSRTSKLGRPHQRESKQPSPIELPAAPSFQNATSSWSPPPSPGTKSCKSTISQTPAPSPRADSAPHPDTPVMTPLSAKEKNQLADKLYAASCAGDLEHIKLLLNMGAPINAGTLVEGLYEAFKPAKSGLLSPLAGAARNGQMDAVELLLACGAPLNPNLHQSSSSPLHQAVRANDVELARFLLELGANVNSLNGYKTTPLMYAVKYGSPDIVKLVLEFRPDLSQLSFIGAAAVHWAVWPNKPETLELLLAAGADCNHAMGDGSTPLHCAAAGGHLDTVVCLLKRGADPARKDDDWKTALQVAEESGHVGIAEVLREAAMRRRTV